MIVSQKKRWPLHQHHLLGGEEEEAEAGGEPGKEGEAGGEEEGIEGVGHHQHHMGYSKYMYKYM